MNNLEKLEKIKEDWDKIKISLKENFYSILQEILSNPKDFINQEKINNFILIGLKNKKIIELLKKSLLNKEIQFEIKKDKELENIIRNIF
jgi:hypothetical protein